MTEKNKQHWEDVYSDKSTDELTWYQRKPEISLELIDEAANSMDKDRCRIIDIGAGASTLEDYLVKDSRYDIAALDIADSALARTRERLGDEAAAKINWLVEDITQPVDLGTFDIWHDRAVFHFLTQPVARQRYLQNLNRTVSVGGYVVISTFSFEGPDSCSGLDVQQYSPKTLAEQLGEKWELKQLRREDHPTPWNGTQNFIYGLFVRV